MTVADPTTTIPLAEQEKSAVALAQAATTAVLNAPNGSEPAWAKPAIAIGSLLLFLAMVIVSIVTKNEQALSMLVGSVITMATTAVSYYLGSSAGSDHKTNLLAGAPPPS